MSDLLEVPSKRRVRGDAHRRGLGWRPSQPDARDHIADASGIKILDEVDPRGEMPPIYDQRQKGACTSHAVKRVVDYDRITDGLDILDGSREAIYFFERLIEHSPLDQDTGAEGRDGFKAYRRVGIPSERDWPYSDSIDAGEWPEWGVDPRSKLPPEAFTKLEKHYKVVPQRLRSMQAVLSNRQMIALGAALYESFESSEVERTGIVPMPGPDERIIGGHEFTVIGYLKDMPLHALCANSWGSKATDGLAWGIDGEGCFLVPFQYLLDPQLTGDLRTIRRAVPSKAH